MSAREELRVTDSRMGWVVALVIAGVGGIAMLGGGVGFRSPESRLSSVENDVGTLKDTVAKMDGKLDALLALAKGRRGEERERRQGSNP